MTKELLMSGRRLKFGFMMLACTLLLSFGVFSGDVFAIVPQPKPELEITGVEGGWRFVDNADEGLFVIEKPGDYTVKMRNNAPTKQWISIADDAGVVNITLDNVNIDTTSSGYGILEIGDNNTVNLTLKGTNTFRYTGGNHVACISCDPGGALNVSGDTLLLKNESIANSDDIYGICSSGSDIKISGATVEINSKAKGIKVGGGGNLTIDDSAAVTINSVGDGIEFENEGVLTIDGGATVNIDSDDPGTGNYPGQLCNGIMFAEGGALTIDGGATVNIDAEGSGIKGDNNTTSISIGGSSIVKINAITNGIQYYNGELTINGGSNCSIQADSTAIMIIQANKILFTDGSTVNVSSKEDCALGVNNGPVTIDEGAIAFFLQTGVDEGNKPAAVSLGFLGGESSITINGGKAVFKSNYSAINEFSRIKFGSNKHKNRLGDSKESAQEVSDKDVTGATEKKYLEVVSVYPITYEYNGGTPANGNPGEYTVDDEFTISNPIKEGYEFAGWTGTDLKSATKEVKICKGSCGPREYTATWNKSTPQTVPAVKTAPVAKKALCYTGVDQELIIPGEATNGHMEYALGTTVVAPKSGWTTAIPKGKEEGDYVIWYRAADDNGATTPQSVKATIYALKVTLKKSSATFNNKKQKIEVKSVSYAGKKIKLTAKEYKLSISPKTVKKAGEYTVTLTVTKKGTYKGMTGTAIYTVKQQANPLTVKRLKKTITVKTADIKTKSKTLKLKELVKIANKQGKLSYELLPGSSDKVTFNTKNGSIKVPKGLAKGKYKVKFKVTAEGNVNYKAKSVSITQTIQVK